MQQIPPLGRTTIRPDIVNTKYNPYMLAMVFRYWDDLELHNNKLLSHAMYGMKILFYAQHIHAAHKK